MKYFTGVREMSENDRRQVRRTGGCYKLIDAFRLLDISPSFGYELIKQGKLQTVRIAPRSPRVTDMEIRRLLHEDADINP
jgi:hypothetical protein